MNKQKWQAGLILCVLLLSAVSVLGQSVSGSLAVTASTEVSVGSNGSGSTENNNSRAQLVKEIREIRKEAHEERRNVRAEVQNEVRIERETLRDERRSMMEVAQSERAAMHQKFADEMNVMRNATRENWKSLLEKNKQERKDLQEELKEKRETFKQQAKDAREKLKATTSAERVEGAQKILTATIDHATTVLIEAQARLEESSLEQNDSTRINAEIAEIDALQVRATALKGKVSLLSNTSTAADVKALNTEVKELVSDIRKEVQSLVLHQQLLHFKGVFEKLNQAQDKLQSMLDRAKAKGVDTVQYQQEIDAINKKLIDAKQSLTAAQRAKESGDNANAATLLHQSEASAKEAIEQIRALHAKIKVNLSANVTVQGGA